MKTILNMVMKMTENKVTVHKLGPDEKGVERYQVKGGDMLEAGDNALGFNKLVFHGDETFVNKLADQMNNLTLAQRVRLSKVKEESRKSAQHLAEVYFPD